MSDSEIHGLDSKSAWHALHTRHQHEKAVSEILAAKGFEVFLPVYTAVHQWKDRKKHLSLPLFPCYVFFRAVDRKLDILRTPGVHGIVETAGRPGIIPEQEILSIRRALGNARIEPYPFLKSGDWVRIKAGPLSGLEGILVRKREHFRLVLCVEMLCRSVAVEVDVFLVERLLKHPQAGAFPASYDSRIPNPPPGRGKSAPAHTIPLVC